MKKIMSAFFAIIFAITFLLPASASATSLGGEISPAISVLRSESVLCKCGVYAETICFSRADYENTVGTELKYITVTSLPGDTAGVLKLNGVPVVSGQTIASSSLNYLTFTPAGNGEGNAAFTFRCDAEGWQYTDILCNVRLTASRNTAPLLNSGAFTTVKNAKTEYRLNILEPDGDDVKYCIDEYPVSGSVSVNVNSGIIIYTPAKGFTGSDSLVIRAIDEYGNSSAAANISITVGKSNIVFSDMSSSSAHAAAIALAESSIVTYVYKDGEYLYNPELSVSRIDFLVMLMASADVNVEGAGTTLPFSDTATLSGGRKQYLAKAVAMSIVSADQTEFRPGESVVRSEAAVWVTKLLGLTGKAAAYTDLGELDAETAACISAVADAGIITASNGLFVPNGTINREEAARILIRIIEN
ncbi:MAG: Ig-like domain-containing protein [Eubacteriales bacterium]|nr:Ig-like domain-containing protein [Eubacteriales bacterium]